MCILTTPLFTWLGSCLSPKLLPVVSLNHLRTLQLTPPSRPPLTFPPPLLLTFPPPPTAGFFAASLNAVNLTMCSHTLTGAKSFEWFCSSRFLQFLVTIVAPYILLIVWQNAVIPAQMYK